MDKREKKDIFKKKKIALLLHNEPTVQWAVSVYFF